MKNKRSKIVILLLTLVIAHSCATYSPQKNAITENNKIYNDGVNIFLIGDAGKQENNQASEALLALEKRISQAKPSDVLLFLGDNIYPKGMPEKESTLKRKNAEQSLQLQLEIAKKFSGKSIFIPGNHDWYNGIDGLKEEGKMVEKTLGKNSFLPEKGCPLATYKINEDIVLITIDSEWFITDWDKHPKINDNCEINTREKFFTEFKSIVNKNQDKQMIIAMHHPLESNGNHGGQYSFSQKNLPILNLPLNVIQRASGISPADSNFPFYRELSNKITTILQEYKSQVIMVSGHDHNLQYLVHKNIPQIISGSGSKVNPVREYKKDSSTFGYAGMGFSVLNIQKSKQEVRFFDAKNHMIHSKIIRKNLENTRSKDVAFDINQTATTKASIYAITPNKSGAYKWFFGNHYRELYNTKIEFPTVNIDTLYGGLKPLKFGGGNQSISLRLEDKDGKEYVMRRLRKSATQFIQVKAFQEEYMKDQLDNTVSERFLMDFYTSSYPFSSLVVGDLSDAVGVYHTNPKVFYVPNQPTIEKFSTILQPDLYLFEERPTKDFKNLKSFGNPDDVISTDEVMNLLMKDEKYSINNDQYIKTRLFDMWLGDWDRHEDQYRWAVRKNADKTISFSPIPRDRDQAFPKFDGFFTQAITNLVPSLRLMQSFDENIKNVKTFNQVIYKTDLTLINQSTLEEWLLAAQFLEENLTDESIEKAFSNLPKELDNKTLESIKSNLKKRRTHIISWAETYYKILNRNIIVLGTNKDDIFEITRLDNGNTSIKVSRNKTNSDNDIVFEKTYLPEYTKEIWLYGLDGKDQFIVKGDYKKCLQIRIIGGQNKDTYTIENPIGIKIYDYKTKESVFEGKPVKQLLTDDYTINNFNYTKFKHNFRQFLPAIGYNPDEGFIVGAKAHFTLYDFENNPFWQKHNVGLKYYTSTGGLEASYSNEIAKVARKFNLAFETRYTSPAYSLNFFGYGNESPNLEENNDIEYLRVRLEQFNAKISLLKRGRVGSTTKFSIPLDIIHPSDNSNRFIETAFTSDELKSKTFVGAEFNYEFENLNNKAFPTLGLKFALTTGWKMNVSQTNQNFAYLNPSLQINYPIIKNDVLTLSSLWSGNLINNTNFEFYQAATIGGQNGVRGFRNQRFTGQNSFFQNTDLRMQLFRFNAGLVPAKFGILGGFDYGRVWIDNDNSTKWHNSVGGGIFANGAGLFSFQTSYFYSNDGGRFVFSLGMGF
tara:strand:+ start:13023 stop:16685 length:3663 start_codon:yes stop_codon:yes gene_type:complete